MDRSAEAPVSEDERAYHIRCKQGDLPPYVLLPGDPGRVERIGQLWIDYRPVQSYREYTTATGRYRDLPVGACSSGIGMGSTEIALQELATIGVQTVIRVGTTGALRGEINCGDVIIPVAGVRLDGTSRLYVRDEFPAFAHYEVMMASIEACVRLGVPYHVGLVASAGSFYMGQARPVAGGYWPSMADHLIGDLQQAGVTNFDMESAGVMVLGHLFGLRVGSVLGVIANRVQNTWNDNGGEARAIAVSCEALAILAEWDALKARQGSRYWYPSLAQRGPDGSGGMS